jgi:hypothetical protein
MWSERLIYAIGSACYPLHTSASSLFRSAFWRGYSTHARSRSRFALTTVAAASPKNHYEGSRYSHPLHDPTSERFPIEIPSCCFFGNSLPNWNRNAPAVLLMDNCRVHLGANTIILLIENNVKVITRPLHRSGIFQMLNLVFFSVSNALKNGVRETLGCPWCKTTHFPCTECMNPPPRVPQWEVHSSGRDSRMWNHQMGHRRSSSMKLEFGRSLSFMRCETSISPPVS